MKIRGKVTAVSGNVAGVCIIRETKGCESCSACPKKADTGDSILVASVPGIMIGQEVILKTNKNWFIRNKILFIVIAFVLGMILAEAIGKFLSSGVFSRNSTMAGGIIAVAIALCIIWMKRPQYLFTIESIERGEH
ncbi:MAG: hypothetical protein ACUBOA_12910 [Candidatus Loosdrechtia sp.]|uniref:SoxR reducing system RseC family protein n=1 Tax=Candidatus Loosdrechtia sp. TaxID=3101272 RepID=UPI003A7686B0|nr:MAG: SoxR reducing system RseC family protein [Candidatus Jettenia sp. AMX2]